jgi:polysaccharide deacetylase family protein (PEP-CTERM system associated)
MMQGGIFLFSVDLEDVRDGVREGKKYNDRVEINTLQYLEWLSKKRAKCTFFIVGEIANRYPHLIKEIINSGHETAGHSFNHTPVEKLKPDAFKRDLSNINALLKAGANNVNGFRAPVFSITENTVWAYRVMEECGITYSSSVLPAKNPLYGWQEFGIKIKQISNIIELPISLNSFGPLNIPFAGGVYFRCMPFGWIMNSFKKKIKYNNPVLSYFHPYDIDTLQEKFMHGGIHESRFFNYLMYFNRSNMFKRLDKVMNTGLTIMRYDDYLKDNFYGL